MPNNSPPEILTITEVVAEWDVSRRTVENWLAGGLQHITFDRKRYMRREHVKAWFGALMAANPEQKTRRKNRRTIT